MKKTVSALKHGFSFDVRFFLIERLGIPPEALPFLSCSRAVGYYVFVRTCEERLAHPGLSLNDIWTYVGEECCRGLDFCRMQYYLNLRGYFR